MTNNRKFMKAQSAMEYLMTYGWAILIIAVVLGALFSLGVFSSGSLLGTSCIAYSGYVCSNPLLHGGVFSATVGQSTGTAWTTVNIIFLGYGAGAPVAGSFTSGCASSFATISSGQQVSFASTNDVTGTVPSTCTALTTSVGVTAAGGLWATYTASGTSGLISQLATLNVKAS